MKRSFANSFIAAVIITAAACIGQGYDTSPCVDPFGTTINSGPTMDPLGHPVSFSEGGPGGAGSSMCPNGGKGSSNNRGPLIDPDGLAMAPPEPGGKGFSIDPNGGSAAGAPGGQGSACDPNGMG